MNFRDYLKQGDEPEPEVSDSTDTSDDSTDSVVNDDTEES